MYLEEVNHDEKRLRPPGLHSTSLSSVTRVAGGTQARSYGLITARGERGYSNEELYHSDTTTVLLTSYTKSSIATHLTITDLYSRRSRKLGGASLATTVNKLAHFFTN